VSQSLEEALELISERANNDPELATALRTVLEGVLAKLPEPTLEPAWHVSPEAEEGIPDPTELEDEAPVYTEWPDLGDVGANLALKARAARWVARHGYTEEREALEERYELLDEARAAGCYLWMMDRNRVDPYQSDALTELADLFELSVRTLDFWQEAGDTAEEDEADQVLAEVQAALRTAAYDVGSWRDPDQYALFQALRLSGQASRTFFPQLSLEYRPLGVADLTARLEALGQARDDREAHERAVKKLVAKARYLVGLVLQASTDPALWRKVDEVRSELMALVVDPTDLLEPLRKLAVPDGLPGLAVLLAEETVPPASAPVQERAWDEPTEAVRRTRDLLEGREVVIVGGEVRPEAAGQLEAAFGCRVRWLDAAPHTSLSVFEPAITGDMAVVLLLIRWSSHVYGELVHVYKARGVPLVRLAGGYSPNRAAHDVLEQAGERMRAAA
jgi:hypothetical protein